MRRVQTSLSRADARRALARFHFEPTTLTGAFHRLRSVQFDPLSPVGSNHDLVLQARVPGYQVGDWKSAAYADRFIYDGWDKQASLVPFSGWPVRRIIHQWHKPWFDRIFDQYPHAVEAVLHELEARGPLTPKELDFQEHKPEWKGSWHGPNLSKQTLRALWHAGKVMTHGRRGSHHVYDLTERIVPPDLFQLPVLSEPEALKELVLERHRAMGLLRPNAQYEVWSFDGGAQPKNQAIQSLVVEGELVQVEIDGVKAHATPQFLQVLDSPEVEPKVVFVAPLDQFVWDRKMTAHLFGFEYVWEVYVPEAKRKWGYYILPVLFGDRFVARAEFWCRDGLLEVRRWHWEPGEPSSRGFWPTFEDAIDGFMHYAGADSLVCAPSVDQEVKRCLRNRQKVRKRSHARQTP